MLRSVNAFASKNAVRALTSWLYLAVEARREAVLQATAVRFHVARLERLGWQRWSRMLLDTARRMTCNWMPQSQRMQLDAAACSWHARQFQRHGWRGWVAFALEHHHRAVLASCKLPNGRGSGPRRPWTAWKVWQAEQRRSRKALGTALRRCLQRAWQVWACFSSPKRQAPGRAHTRASERAVGRRFRCWRLRQEWREWKWYRTRRRERIRRIGIGMRATLERALCRALVHWRRERRIGLRLRPMRLLRRANTLHGLASSFSSWAHSAKRVMPTRAHW